MPNPTFVLCESPDARPAEQALVRELASLLADQPEVNSLIIPSLYDTAPDGPAAASLRAVSSDLVVLSWLNSRAAFWVLDALGIKGRMGEATSDGTERTIWCVDLRKHDDAASVLRGIERVRGVSFQPAAPSTDSPAALRVEEPFRTRWYPVIDRDACVNCLECLNFCLFGVYGLDDAGRIFVEQPDACRDGCPACARICPSGAILFPAHADPAIAGDAPISTAGPVADELLLKMANIQKLAETERQRAMVQDPQSIETQASPAESDFLDRLVDEVEQTEL